MKNPAHSALHPHRRLLFAGAVCAALAVVLGAFGAHALQDRLVASGHLAVWETAVDYQFWHALALIVLALIPPTGSRRLLSAAGILFGAGIILFCGSLYGLALDGPRWLGPITPLGGLAFIAGWTTLAIFASNRTVKD